MIKVSDNISTIWYSGVIFFQILCWSKIRKCQEINLTAGMHAESCHCWCCRICSFKLNENIPVSSRWFTQWFSRHLTGVLFPIFAIESYVDSACPFINFFTPSWRMPCFVSSSFSAAATLGVPLNSQLTLREFLLNIHERYSLNRARRQQ